MPRHTIKEHKHTDAHVRTHVLKPPSRLREPCPDLSLPVKGVLLAAHNSTTDPLCSSCKFCSFSSGAQKSAALFCEKREEVEGGQENRGVKPLSVCDCEKSLSLHEGWNCVCASVCVCECLWCVTLYSPCAHKKSQEQGVYSLGWKHRAMLQTKSD